MILHKEIKTTLALEWVLYSKSYLSLARIGIEELESKKYVRTVSFEHLFSYEEKLLLIAIIWNIKHGIELILKSLNVQINKGVLKSHNLFDLQNMLKESICAAGLKITKEKKIRQLIDLTIKYYTLNFWRGRITNTKIIKDIKNEIFRFPDNKQSFVLDLRQFKETSPSEIMEIRRDLEKLEKLFGVLKSQIHKYKYPVIYKKYNDLLNKQK